MTEQSNDEEWEEIPTLTELVAKYRITAEARHHTQDPDGTNHWTVILRRGGIGEEDPEYDVAPRYAREWGMVIDDYSAGKLVTEVTPEDVLRCLILDTQTYEDARDFEEWAEEVGLNPDSIKDHEVYQQVERQRYDLINFLSDSARKLVRVAPGGSGIAEIIGGEHYDEFMECDLE